MRDWQGVVREKLGDLRLGPDREARIVRELAHHLEDCCEELRAAGMSADAAEAAAASADWAGLARGVRSALRGRNDMTERLRRYFIPALLMHVLAAAVLVAVQYGGIEPRVILVEGVPGGGIMFYIPWLLFLPIVGALRGLLARKRGEDGQTAVIGAALPALILGALFIVAMFGGLVEHAIKGGLGIWYAKAAGTMLLTWVLMPGLAMVAGVLPLVMAGRRKTAAI